MYIKIDNIYRYNHRIIMSDKYTFGISLNEDNGILPHLQVLASSSSEAPSIQMTPPVIMWISPRMGRSSTTVGPSAFCLASYIDAGYG